MQEKISFHPLTFVYSFHNSTLTRNTYIIRKHTVQDIEYLRHLMGTLILRQSSIHCLKVPFHGISSVCLCLFDHCIIVPFNFRMCRLSGFVVSERKFFSVFKSVSTRLWFFSSNTHVSMQSKLDSYWKSFDVQFYVGVFVCTEILFYFLPSKLIFVWDFFIIIFLRVCVCGVCVCVWKRYFCFVAFQN